MGNAKAIKVKPSDELVALVEKLEKVWSVLEGGTIQLLKPAPGSTVVIKRPIDAPLLNDKGLARFKKHCKKLWPDCKIVIFEEGMSVECIVHKSSFISNP